MNARNIVNTLLETDAKYPLQQIGKFMDVLPTHVQKHIMSGMNSSADSSTLSRSFKTALSPYKRKLSSVGIEFDFFAYLLVAVRNKLRPDLGNDEFGQAIAGQMDRFTVHIKPVEVEHQITATDIFGPASLN